MVNHSMSLAQQEQWATEFYDCLVEESYEHTGYWTKEFVRRLYYEEFKESKIAQGKGKPSLSFSCTFYIMKNMYLIRHSKRNRVTLLDTDDRVVERRRPHARLAVDQYTALPDDLIGKIASALEQLRLEDNGHQEDFGELPREVERVNSHLSCKVCRVIMRTRDEIDRHLQGRRHRVQKLIYYLKKNRDELTTDKFDVSISSLADSKDASIRLELEEGQPQRVAIRIKNLDKYENVQLVHCEMLRRLRVFTINDKKGVTDGKGAVVIPPGGVYEVMVTAHARHVNRFHAPLAFLFKRESLPGVDIHIVRYLSASCHNALVDQLQPKEPYKAPPRVAIKKETVEVVEGFPLPRGEREELEREIELGTYYVPAPLRTTVNHGLKERQGISDREKQEIANVRHCLKNAVSWEQYVKTFSTLLHIEEIQMEVDIRKYDMKAVTMTRCKERSRLLVLKVPGLAENRPSVLRGDCLFVRFLNPDGTPESKEYKGYVHDTRLTEVWLGLNQRLLDRFIEGMKFNVRFVFNRLPVRAQHRAVQLAEENSLHEILFPKIDRIGALGTTQPLDTRLRLYDQQLERNEEQFSAVRHIVSGTSRPAPYLVFGPPGTGKTVTVVEAMKQILRSFPDSATILACAPSNSAADLITQRLVKHVSKHLIYRLNAVSRSWQTVPEEIRECCNYSKDQGSFYFPSKTELMKYKVLVCTLVTAGRLASANFPPGHFSHVFIDEAGHAVEPEALIAVAGVLETDVCCEVGGQLVLAGDPKQLGPVLRSPLAIKGGLGMSLLERLMTTSEVYQKRVLVAEDVPTYDPRVLTKLVKNYRSHPAILEMPNELFYDSELVPHADKMVREMLCHWEGLPKRGFPIVFHGVVGRDMREERSPSFFNPEEASEVVRFTKELLEARSFGINVKEKEIGIISPYRKQVQKLQSVLRDKRGITVGSVEEFQGQERKVIIISTVRSNPDHLALDRDFKLGFLSNPKRFNVAITRAKALLIVVGNPHVLCRDQWWNSFLRYVQDNGGYSGCDFDELEDQMEDIEQRFQAVNISADRESPALPAEGLDVSQVQHQEDPEWRSER